MRSLNLISRRATEGRQRKRKHFRFWLFAIFVCVCVAGIFAGIRYGSAFQIADVRMTGLPESVPVAVVRESLERMFAGRMLARAFGMENIFAWPARAVVKETNIPVLSSIAVRTDLFARRLVVGATSRERFGIWCFEGRAETACSWFDGTDGVLMEETPVPDGNLIPTIRESVPESFELLLGTPAVEQAILSRIRATLAFFEAQSLPLRMVRIDRAHEELQIGITGGPTIRMSTRFDPVEPLAALMEFFSGHTRSLIVSVDLTVEHKLYWKPK